MQGRNVLNGAEALVRMLQLHGVKHIFGLCGDTSLPFYDALFRLDHGMTHILTRDERHAAYMADGYARISGKVGVCEGPSGGGATYILPGLVEANESSIPVLGITTDVSTKSHGRFPLTELDQQALFRPLTKWNRVIEHAEMLPGAVRDAFRAMTTGTPGAAHIGLPFDVQKGDVPEDEIWAQAELGRYPAWPAAPDAPSLAALADALLAAKSPLIICGGGLVIAGAEEELFRLAERLEIPIATTITGQGAIAEDHPLALGVVGSNGGVAETRAVVKAADLVFFIGCRAGSVTTERWRYPAPGTTIIHLDSDPAAISAAFETTACALGDARLGLAGLNRILDDIAELPKFNGAAPVARAKQAKFATFGKIAQSNETPIRPERVIAALQNILPADAIVVADPGTPCPYVSAYYEFRAPGRHFISNRAHGALGYAMSAAMGAHIARPGAKTIALMGDGSFGFTVGEFETVVRLGLPITFIVFSNAVYGWIKAGQKSGFGGRYFSVDFDRTDHAAIASAYGVKSWAVEDPDDLHAALSKAVEHGGPALVDIISQPLQDARTPVSEWVA